MSCSAFVILGIFTGSTCLTMNRNENWEIMLSTCNLLLCACATCEEVSSCWKVEAVKERQTQRELTCQSIPQDSTTWTCITNLYSMEACGHYNKSPPQIAKWNALKAGRTASDTSDKYWCAELQHLLRTQCNTNHLLLCSSFLGQDVVKYKKYLMDVLYVSYNVYAT